MTQNKGLFITVEGIEGAGKSTAIQFLEDLCKQHQIPYVLTREPGGTEIAESIREILLSHHNETMNIDAELLLMFASRAQHIASVIKPALAAGKVVLCDRFTDASFAYQGGGRKIDEQRIVMLEEWVQQGLQPDLTILLDLPGDVGLQRANNRSQADRIESEAMEFFERVRAAYLQRAERYPARFRVVDVEVALEQVQTALLTLFEQEILTRV